MLFGLLSLISAIISWPLALWSCLPSSISWLHFSPLSQPQPRFSWATRIFLAVPVRGHVLPLIRTVFRKQDLRGCSSCPPSSHTHTHTKAPNTASNHGDAHQTNPVTSLQVSSDVVSPGCTQSEQKIKIQAYMFYTIVICFGKWKR